MLSGFTLQVAPHPIRFSVEDICLLLSIAYILSTLEARFPPTALNIISSAIRKGTALAIDTLLSVSVGLACRWDSQLIPIRSNYVAISVVSAPIRHSGEGRNPESPISENTAASHRIGIRCSSNAILLWPS